jgi:hypothetical protein
VLHSFPQTLGLVAPSLIPLWSPEHGAEDDERGERYEGEKQSHRRSPFCANGVKDKGCILMSCLGTWLIRSLETFNEVSSA